MGAVVTTAADIIAVVAIDEGLLLIFGAEPRRLLNDLVGPYPVLLTSGTECRWGPLGARSS